MAKKKPRAGVQRPPELPQSVELAASTAIDSISLRGFKSHRDTKAVALRPLTVLAGENSGGKSSIVQPLLLMKQTLEAQYDPGVLDLRGSCVKLDRVADVVWRGALSGDLQKTQSWCVRLGIKDVFLEIEYCLDPVKGGVSLARTHIILPNGKTVSVSEGMTPSSATAAFRELSGAGVVGQFFSQIAQLSTFFNFRVLSDRCAHGFSVIPKDASPQFASGVHEELIPRNVIERMIHLPGLRGNPERVYRVTRVAGRFPGLFQDYTASVLADWQENQSPVLQGVKEDLALLRLTRHVQTARVDDTRVEVKLGRRLDGSDENDVVSIADVGFGASQALPVVVALRAAGRDQLVHIEQPELHLHPNAQVAMASLLIAAANRGARLIVETHSSVLLKAIQVAIAEDVTGRLQKEIALHWFERDESGASVVRTADLAADGSFGDWPVDFADVEMDIHRRFIRASGQRRRGAT